MESNPAALPRDPDVLIGMILELREENSRLRGILETMQRALYGARSERFENDAAQPALDLDDTSEAPVEPPQPKPEPQNRPAKPALTRNIGRLPKHLPREDIVIEPGIDACPCCQGRCIASVRTSAKCSTWCRR